MGASLGAMVANLSANKRGWDERWEEFSQWAVQAENLRTRLLELVDEDTRSYARILEAMQMPKGSPEEAEARKTALHEATKGAILVPMETLRTCIASMKVADAMVNHGMPSSVSDACVGVLCGRAGAIAAYLNVRTNLVGLEDEQFRQAILKEAEALKTQAEELEAAALKFTLAKF